MEVKSNQNITDHPSCDPCVTFLVIIFIILIAILVKLISGIWLQQEPQVNVKTTEDRFSRMLEDLLKVKNSLKKLTVKFFPTLTDEEKQSILNSSSNGKKKIVVVKLQTDQDGITRSSSHVIILPELSTEKNVGENEPSTGENEMGKKISAKNKPKGLGKGEKKTKTSSVGDDNNPEDIRVLVESFRKKLPLFVENEEEKLPNLTSKTHWLDLESKVLQKWIDSCLENREIASTEEEEEDIEPEMYISYNKKDFNKTFFCHPSLFPFAAVARIFKLILQTTLIFGVIILAFIVIAFAKVKETHGCFYIRDQIAKTNTFQNLRNAFGAIYKYHAPEAVLHLQSTTSSCSSRISLQTIIEDTASIHQGQSLYDWEWIEKVYLSKEGSCKFHNDYSEV
ncbi:hypothetical protein AVEN_75779-1 [Araneus ventricosus]|uniref:Uncharacterized protein n=1 Tax=Araneus ventricosus TaxID=182803 RepID=A0A4Y2L7V7_ARAVE|nr:hypothetical protein AVEN_75779-1 [Araneus ventricosus]